MADLICRKTMMRCQTQGMCSPHGGCQHSHSAAPRQPAGVDGPDYGDGPEFEGWAERSGSEAAKLLLPALRQYMHNDGSGLLAGYDLETTQAIIDGLRGEVEVMTQHANNYSRMFEECAEERDHLAQCLKFARTTMAVVANNANLRGVEHRSLVAEVKRIEAALSAGKEVEAPGPVPAVKLCVACRTLHPLDHFDKAAPDFPTRDGLNCNCRKSVAERGYRLMRLPNGKVEPRP